MIKKEYKKKDNKGLLRVANGARRSALAEEEELWDLERFLGVNGHFVEMWRDSAYLIYT